MGSRSDYKKYDELTAWDLDAGCRSIVDQSRPGRRRLKKALRRQARKRLKIFVKMAVNHTNGDEES